MTDLYGLLWMICAVLLCAASALTAQHLLAWCGVVVRAVCVGVFRRTCLGFAPSATMSAFLQATAINLASDLVLLAQTGWCT